MQLPDWTEKQENERSNERPEVYTELVEERHMDWVLWDCLLVSRLCVQAFFEDAEGEPKIFHS